MISGLIDEDGNTTQPEMKPQKINNEVDHKNVKRADESADNDKDRPAPPTVDEAKKATDEAYMKDQHGKGTSPSSGRE